VAGKTASFETQETIMQAGTGFAARQVAGDDFLQRIGGRTLDHGGERLGIRAGIEFRTELATQRRHQVL
jgi:hypothetical protein